MSNSDNPTEQDPNRRLGGDSPPPASPVPRYSSGGAPPATGGVSSGFVSSMPYDDLCSEELILSAPRIDFDGKTVPSLGGIPLIAKIGQGGMGAVYYGIHPRLGKEVAVKVLPFHLAQHNPGMVKRFFQEARIAARIQSPHLVGVMDVNQDGGLYFLVMEFVRGVSAQGFLKQVKQAGMIGASEAAALDVCIAATAGLATAHGEGVIHRDVKPDNILIPRRKGTDELIFTASKLADLGLARSEELAQTMTGVGAFLGTPGYMAPEQIEDAKSCGKPADIFAMGATLYALLSGSQPFTASGLMRVLKATQEQPHPAIRNLRSDISPAVAELIDYCLEKKPENRYPDAAGLLVALKQCRDALPDAAMPPSGLRQSNVPLPRASQVGGNVRDGGDFGLGNRSNLQNQPIRGGSKFPNADPRVGGSAPLISQRPTPLPRQAPISHRPEPEPEPKPAPQPNRAFYALLWITVILALTALSGGIYGAWWVYEHVIAVVSDEQKAKNRQALADAIVTAKDAAKKQEWAKVVDVLRGPLTLAGVENTSDQTVGLGLKSSAEAELHGTTNLTTTADPAGPLANTLKALTGESKSAEGFYPDMTDAKRQVVMDMLNTVLNQKPNDAETLRLIDAVRKLPFKLTMPDDAIYAWTVRGSFGPDFKLFNGVAEGTLFKGAWIQAERNLKDFELARGADSFRSRFYVKWNGQPEMYLKLDGAALLQADSPAGPWNLAAVNVEHDDDIQVLEQGAADGPVPSVTLKVPFTGTVAALLAKAKPEALMLQNPGDMDALREISSLVRLEILDDDEMFRLPNLSLCPRLAFLGIYNCTALTDIEGVKNARSLMEVRIRNCNRVEDFFPLKALPNLSVVACENMKGLKSLSFISGLGSLKEFLADTCENLSDARGLSAIAGLERLTIRKCKGIDSFGFLKELANLRLIALDTADEFSCETLKNLKGLKSVALAAPKVWNLELLSACDKMENLSLTCGNLTDLSAFGKLPRLTQLNLTKCDALQTLRGVEDFPALKSIGFWSCKSLTNLGALSSCKLEKAVFYACDNLRTLTGLENQTNLQEMSITSCGALTDISALAGSRRMNAFSISVSNALVSADVVRNFTALDRLLITYCAKIASIDAAANLKNLKRFDFSGCKSVKKIAAVAQMTQLEELGVDGEGATDALPSLSGLTKLKKLSLNSLATLRNLETIGDLAALENIFIYNCQALSDVSALARLKRLSVLAFSFCDGLTSLKPLDQLSGLITLKIDYSSGVTSLDPLRGLARLRYLDISGCYKVKDLEPLGALDLLVLSLPYNAELASLAPLRRMTGLVKLTLADRSKKCSFSVVQNMQRLEHLNLDFHVTDAQFEELRSSGVLDRLKSINFLGTNDLTNLTPLTGAKRLKHVEFFREDSITDLKPLESLRKLNAVRIHNSNIPKQAIDNLKVAMPYVQFDVGGADN